MPASDGLAAKFRALFALFTPFALLALLPAAAVTAAVTAPAAGLPPAGAGLDARLLRHPHVSATHVTFVHAGDVWLVPKEGGVAHRLSTPAGEESFPRFSPDGRLVAFSAAYDGSLDVHVMPAAGGPPVRLTHHPGDERVLGWHPDGRRVLFASSAFSATGRWSELFLVPVEGGAWEKLPVPQTDFATFSPDGRKIAFVQFARDFRTWKRYRGGLASDVWIFDLESGEATNVTRSAANDAMPSWHGSTLYFHSDRDANSRANVWAYELETDRFRQVTHFTEHDVGFPATGPADLVFENGGRLYLLELAGERLREVPVRVVTDRATLRPQARKVADLIQVADISPTGLRVVMEARGEIFTLPAKHGAIRNLTRTSGVAERHPAWSPDGKSIAYFSDRSGEYELTVRAADGSGDERTVTALGQGFRYRPHWSPDGKRVAYVDQAMRVHVTDVASGRTSVIDRDRWLYEGGLRSFRVSWSPDSRHLAYARGGEARQATIVLHDVRRGSTQQVTSGYYHDTEPAFDPEGRYLYYLSGREFSPAYSDLDNTWIYANTTRIVAVPLRADVASPLLPRHDEEGRPPAGRRGRDEKGARDGKDAEGKASARRPPANVGIDIDGFESRGVVLPLPAGNYRDLAATAEQVLVRRRPRTGMDDEKSPIVGWSLDEREEKTLVEDSDGFRLAHEMEKLLTWKGGKYHVADVKPETKLDDPLRTSELEVEVEPAAEWRQVFTDAWRFQRDYFYDPNLHGVDWPAMRERYGRLLDQCVTRWDVNFVIGELIGELNASHTYRGGGDLETARERPAGLLGADFRLENGAWRIARILRGAPWDLEPRSPLAEPGIGVQEGEYLLAVNGAPVEATRDPWAPLVGLADQVVTLRVGPRPTLAGSREVIVKTLASESRLRYLDWVESNRRRVEEATFGRVGYVHVPDTGRHGQAELVRQFRAQVTKDGLIVDERFNGGGQIPDRFVELLNRPVLNYWGVRDGEDWQWPPVAHQGPKVMLINARSGSGGDAFPHYFRRAGLGPLIGTRTWGGLIGITGAPALIDGGRVTVPTFGIYDLDGEWIIEGHGVEPDLEVIDDPAALARGVDPQLEAGIAEVMRRLARQPPTRPQKPAYPVR